MRHFATPAATALLALLVQPAHAEDARHDFDIPAQPLGSALQALAEQAGAPLFFAEHSTAGKRSPGLKGRYTTGEAVGALLAGSGLSHAVAADGTVAVKPAPGRESRDVTLAPVKVIEQAGYDSTDPYNPDYNRPNATTATKTDTPIMETPMSIQVVPKAVLQDRKVNRIQEALENVSGVRSDAYLDIGGRFTIRGFSNAGRIYRNGLGLIGGFGGFTNDFDTANLESIEVLKGPAAVLYGRIEPGGLVNVNTKRPLTAPYYALEQRFGSYDFYRTEWDATGPITNDGSLSYRFTGAYQDTNSFRDFVFHERVMVNPSLTWRLSEATSFTLEVEGMNHDFHAEFGIPAIGNRPAPIPLGRSYSDPGIAPSNLSHALVATDLTHRFNDSWTLRNRFLTLHGGYNTTYVNAPFTNPLRADNRTFDRNMWFQESPTEAYTTNLDLTGQLSLWGSRHEILVGTDYTLGVDGYHFVSVTPDPARAIDLLDPGPNYGRPNPLFRGILDPALNPESFSVAKQEWWGVYFQDHITLWDKLHILGGGRHDWAETGRGFGTSFNEAEKALYNSSPTIIRKDEAFSPRVGILYQVQPWLSAYGNWTTSFGANNGLSASRQPHPPQKGEQYEAGLKTELFDRRLSATLAFYHLAKQNILTADLRAYPNR